jgi:hypothetical protein
MLNCTRLLSEQEGFHPKLRFLQDDGNENRRERKLRLREGSITEFFYFGLVILQSGIDEAKGPTAARGMRTGRLAERESGKI